MNLRELEERVVQHDSKHWEHGEKKEGMRHNFTHMGKDLGRIATFVEAWDHGEFPVPHYDQICEAIGNEFIIMTRFARMLGCSIEDLIEQFFGRMEVRFEAET